MVFVALWMMTRERERGEELMRMLFLTVQGFEDAHVDSLVVFHSVCCPLKESPLSQGRTADFEMPGSLSG